MPAPVTTSQVSSSVKCPATVTKRIAGTNTATFHGTKRNARTSADVIRTLRHAITAATRQNAIQEET